MARRYQNMHRSLRMDVGKRVALFVLVDGGGGYASVNDLAKKAAHNASSVQESDTLLYQIWTVRQVLQL
jgi:hypothetical protein